VAVAALPVVEPDEPDTLPVTLPVRLPVKVPAIAPVPVMVGSAIVGLVPKTAAPVPVSSVKAPRRFVLDGLCKAPRRFVESVYWLYQLQHQLHRVLLLLQYGY
jgi:hypothetical protein